MDQKTDFCPVVSSAMGYIRDNEKIRLSMAFILMVAAIPVVQTLWFVDAFMLNLLHPVDLFFSNKDWKKCFRDLFFGTMYLLATRSENLTINLLCGTVVVVAWLASNRMDGSPCIKWVFFSFLSMWVLGYVNKVASDAVVYLEVLRTVCLFMFNHPDKTLEDALLVFAFLSFHLLFAKVAYSIHYLALSYIFSAAWMFFKY